MLHHHEHLGWKENIWGEEVKMTKYDNKLSMKAKTITEKDNRLVEPVPDISSV